MACSRSERSKCVSVRGESYRVCVVSEAYCTYRNEHLKSSLVRFRPSDMRYAVRAKHMQDLRRAMKVTEGSLFRFDTHLLP